MQVSFLYPNELLFLIKQSSIPQHTYFFDDIYQHPVHLQNKRFITLLTITEKTILFCCSSLTKCAYAGYEVTNW